MEKTASTIPTGFILDVWLGKTSFPPEIAPSEKTPSTDSAHVFFSGLGFRGGGGGNTQDEVMCSVGKRGVSRAHYFTLRTLLENGTRFRVGKGGFFWDEAFLGYFFFLCGSFLGGGFVLAVGVFFFFAWFFVLLCFVSVRVLLGYRFLEGIKKKNIRQMEFLWSEWCESFG